MDLSRIVIRYSAKVSPICSGVNILLAILVPLPKYPIKQPFPYALAVLKLLDSLFQLPVDLGLLF